MSQDQISQWYTNLNFTSLYSIFQEVNEAEWALSDYYENMSAEELSNSDFNPDVPVYSEEYKDAVSKGYLRVFTEEDGTENYDLNLRERNMALVLNTQQSVMVGNSLFVYSYDNRKIKEYATLADLPMLKATLVNSEEEDIHVIHYQLSDVEKATASNGRTAHEGWGHEWNFTTGNPQNLDPWVKSSNGKNRMRSWISGNSYLDYAGTTHGQGSKMYCTFNLGVQIQKKNIWGNWKYDTQSVSIYTSWDYNYKYHDEPYHRSNDLPVQDNFPPLRTSPFSFSNGLNNFSPSLHPHVNGYYVSDTYDCGYPVLGICGGFEEAINLTSVYGYVYWRGSYHYYPVQGTYWN